MTATEFHYELPPPNPVAGLRAIQTILSVYGILRSKAWGAVMRRSGAISLAIGWILIGSLGCDDDSRTDLPDAAAPSRSAPDPESLPSMRGA
jgi:hypothetical protein